MTVRKEKVDIRSLHPMEDQPRKVLTHIPELADTFDKNGFAGGIVIWYPKFDHREIISGHRSHAALIVNGEKYHFEPPAIVEIEVDVIDGINRAKAFELAILYNETHEPLTVLERAEAWKVMRNTHKCKSNYIADTFHVSKSTVSNTISLCDEPDYIKGGILEGKLTMIDVLQLRRIGDADKRKEIALKVIAGEIVKTAIKEYVTKPEKTTKEQEEPATPPPETKTEPIPESKTEGDGALPEVPSVGPAVSVQYQVVVHCDNEDAQLAILQRLQEEGLVCEPVTI